MIFQTLDDKEQCVAIYCDKKICKDVEMSGLSRTWNYAKYLDNLDIKYANLYCLGESLDSICPEHLRNRWESISNKLKAFLISFGEAHVNLNENCFFDMVPERFLLEFCEIKNSITQHVFENYDKPKNYDFLVSLTKMLHDIKYQTLNIDYEPLHKKLENYKTRQFFKKMQSIEHSIVYDISGTKTGRLTTKKNSFPIMTLSKAHREILKPKNDYFVELDFNAAELRTLLSLSGKHQPKEDLHEWNIENIYKNISSRDEAKKRIFAWLYNPESVDQFANSVYDRDAVIEKYFNGSQVYTIFDRHIQADRHHALNYIIQSTTSDLFLRQAIKIWEILQDRKSEVSFCIHDSLVIDYSVEENDIFKELVETFSTTFLGEFKTNVSIGTNFADMRKIAQ